MKPRKTEVPVYLIFAIEIIQLFSFNINELTQFNCCREWPIEFSKSFDHALSASLSLFLVLLITHHYTTSNIWKEFDLICF